MAYSKKYRRDAYNQARFLGNSKFTSAKFQGKVYGYNASANLKTAGRTVGRWAAANPGQAIALGGAAGAGALSTARILERRSAQRQLNKRQRSRERVAMQKAKAGAKRTNSGHKGTTGHTGNHAGGKKGRRGAPTRGAGGKFTGWSS